VTFQVSVAGTASGTIANRGDGEHTAGHDRHHAGQQHRHGHHHVGLVADLGISKTASTATPSGGRAR
jgi:hypothetical protein